MASVRRRQELYSDRLLNTLQGIVLGAALGLIAWVVVSVIVLWVAGVVR